MRNKMKSAQTWMAVVGGLVRSYREMEPCSGNRKGVWKSCNSQF